MGKRVALLAVLVLITAGIMYWMNEKGKTHSCEANLVVLAGAAEVYVIKEGQPPQAIEDLVPKYIKALPHCENQPEVDYVMKVTEKEVEFYCGGTAHKMAGLEADHPRISSPIRTPKRPQPADS